MSKVYIFLADGFEEVEGLTQVDLLRRAGADVKTVSITDSKSVTGSHNILVGADMTISELKEDADLVVLPGGLPGTNHLKESMELAKILKSQDQAGRLIGAICAAPSVLVHHGMLKDRRATSYPGSIDEDDCKEYQTDPVVRDGNVITSRGVGTAIPFALALIEALYVKKKADEIAASIIYNQER